MIGTERLPLSDDGPPESLRDVFASLALVGLLAGKLVTPQSIPGAPPGYPGVIVCKDAAKLAYSMADAMMAARLT